MSFESHLAAAEPLLHRYGYAAVFATNFVEGFGIPAPGQTLLIAASVLAARDQVSLPDVLVAAATGAMLGNVVGWAIGRWGGRRVLIRIAVASRLARIEALFARWGRGVVLVGRFLDGVRQVHPIVAGALQMRLPSFLLWSTLGTVAWTCTWGLGAYFLGRDIGVVTHGLHEVRPPVVVALAVVAVGVIVWLVFGRRESPSR